MGVLLEKNIEKAKARLEEETDNSVENAISAIERQVDRETNEKIMAINEYADTVMDDMNKSHDEILFLYSMLNDRHGELENLSAELKNLDKEIEEKKKLHEVYLEAVGDADRRLRENIDDKADADSGVSEKTGDALEKKTVLNENAFQENPSYSLKNGENLQQEERKEEAVLDQNRNAQILHMAKDGMDSVEIAKELGVGTGLVNLVIGLYRGDETS
jgi:DNA polymerase III delta prime subunit